MSILTTPIQHGYQNGSKKGKKKKQKAKFRKIEKNCLFHKRNCLSRQSHATYKTSFFWKQQMSLAKLQNITSTPENQPHFYILGVNYQKPKNIKFLKFVHFQLCWALIAACRISLVVASRGYSSLELHRGGFSCAEHGLQGAQPSEVAVPGLTAVALGLSYPEACGIFPDRGLNPHPLHWQADSQPLSHQESSQEPKLLKITFTMA